MMKLGMFKQRIVFFSSLKTGIVFTLTCVKSACRSTMVPALFQLHRLSAGEAAVGVDHAPCGNFSAGESFGGPTPAWVTVLLAAVVLLPKLVVVEEGR